MFYNQKGLSFASIPLTPRCCCGRLVGEHTLLETGPSMSSWPGPGTGQQEEWSVECHTQTSATDAYGTIDFQDSTEHNCHAKVCSYCCIHVLVETRKLRNIQLGVQRCYPSFPLVFTTWKLVRNCYLIFMWLTMLYVMTVQYVRVAVDAKAEALLQLMLREWQMERPKLLLTVHGGAENFPLPLKVRQAFSKGLITAAQSTGAWIITDGINTGV